MPYSSSSSSSFNPPLTLYGGTRTTTFATTVTVTPDQQSITINYPNPPVVADISFTTVSTKATQPNDLESSIYLTNLPILVLTDVIGIIVNTGGSKVAIKTLVQPLPPQATSTTSNSLAVLSHSKRLIVVIVPTIAGLLLILAFLFLFWRSRLSRQRKSNPTPEEHWKSGPWEPKIPETGTHPMIPILSNVEQILVNDMHQKSSPQPAPPEETRSGNFVMLAAVPDRKGTPKEIRRGRSMRDRDSHERPSRRRSTKAKGLEQGILPEGQHSRQSRSLDNGSRNDNQSAEHMGGVTWIGKNERGSVEREPERRRESGKGYNDRDRRGRDYKDERVNDRRRSRPRSASPPRRRRSKSKSKRRNSDSHGQDWAKWLAVLPLALEAVHLLSEPKGGWETYLMDEHKKELEDKSKLKKHAKQYGEKLLEGHIRRHRAHRREDYRPAVTRSRSSDYGYERSGAPRYQNLGLNNRRLSDMRQAPEARARAYDSDDEPGPSNRTRHSRRDAKMQDSDPKSYEAHPSSGGMSDIWRATSLPEKEAAQKRDSRREGTYERDLRGGKPPPHSYIRMNSGNSIT